MIPQLAYRLAGGTSTTKPTDAALADATADVLSADPLDLVLYCDQLWALATPPPDSVTATLPARGIRQHLASVNRFNAVPAATHGKPWDHLGYSFCIDNTRAPQILLRVLSDYRSGEGLGIPSAATQRWLDATEVLLAGGINPMAGWLSTRAVRPSAEAVRRNAYWRVFNMDLSFGTDANEPFVYDKAETSNRKFPQLFEELLVELWRAIDHSMNPVAASTTDNDRIFQLANQLGATSCACDVRTESSTVRNSAPRWPWAGSSSPLPPTPQSCATCAPRQPPLGTACASSVIASGWLRTARPAPCCPWPASSRSC